MTDNKNTCDNSSSDTEQHPIRLDKYLTQSSLGTRKKVHGILAAGEITVNNIVETDATRRIDPAVDQVCCKGEAVVHQGKLYYMLNKPKGYICARSDARHATVMERFGAVNTEGLFIVGRLDKDTEGLLILTNDGELDHWLMSPDSHVEKTYFFVAEGHLTKEEENLLEMGVVIRAGEPKTMPAKLEQVCNYMAEGAAAVRGGSGLSHERVCGYLTIKEGQKHQVKRMLKAVGCHVIELKRTAIGGVELDEKLVSGEYRLFTDSEVNILMAGLRCDF